VSIAERPKLQVRGICSCGYTIKVSPQRPGREIRIALQGWMRHEHEILPSKPHPARAGFAVWYPSETPSRGLAASSEYVDHATEIDTSNQMYLLGKLSRMCPRCCWGLQTRVSRHAAPRPEKDWSSECRTHPARVDSPYTASRCDEDARACRWPQRFRSEGREARVRVGTNTRFTYRPWLSAARATPSIKLA